MESKIQYLTHENSRLNNLVVNRCREMMNNKWWFNIKIYFNKKKKKYLYNLISQFFVK
jgi:hypothetical protein